MAWGRVNCLISIYLNTHVVQLPGKTTPSMDLGRNGPFTEPDPSVNRAGDYQDPSVQMNNLPSLSLNTQRAKPMKETQKRAGTFNRYLFTIGRKTQSRVIRISNANNVQQKHLTILLRQDRPAHRHTHPKKKWTRRVFIRLSSRGG